MKILLADDHNVLRKGLRAFREQSDLEVVGEASDGRQAVTLANTLKPISWSWICHALMNGPRGDQANPAAQSVSMC